MILEVKRYSDSNGSTLGLLFVDGVFECYTLEDEYRTEKVFAETRIPEGEYEIAYRKEGGHHARYSSNYPTMHKGMLELQDVPNFKYILIHIGNDEDDTAGCLLVGNSSNNNQVTQGFIGHSSNAYKKLYTKVSNAIESNECVTIKYSDVV